MSGLRVLEHPLFLLDYDGTLADIVDNPDEAFPHPEVPELLKRLKERYPVYILTGRSLSSLAQLLPVTGLEVVGVHGLERGRLGETAAALVEPGRLEALQSVRQNLPDIAGVKLEDKTLSLALHYREASPAGVAELRRWAETVPAGLDRLWGKRVLELRPHGYSKGRAATQLAKTHPQTTPLAIGDDTTDEEMFAALPQGLTIKVGEGESAARERLAEVTDVVAYLRNYLR